jgi:flagellar biosynthesis protein FlhG
MSSLGATRYAPSRRAAAGRAGAPRIWAIAGGKGGVGKSLVASNLAVSFAGHGMSCVLVDADLGGANLHTIFGVPTPRSTLSHFLNGEAENLTDVLCETSVPNLRLASGSHALLGMANLKYTQKEKFLRHISRLSVDHVLLDLGAGSAYNVLDFFLAARQGILVVVPEPTSIENAYYFLKAAFYRSLRLAARQPNVRAALQQVLGERLERRVRSPLALIAGVMRVDRQAGGLLWANARLFTPGLIVNQVTAESQLGLGEEMAEVCAKQLGIQLRYLGALERDESVLAAVQRKRPVLQLFPHSRWSLGMEEIAAQLLGAEPPQRTARATQQPLPRLDATPPGAYLRSCRERLALNLSQLTERTRIRSLDAIENERFDVLPPEPYVHRHVLEYARALGIEQAHSVAEAFVDRYRRARAGC